MHMFLKIGALKNSATVKHLFLLKPLFIKVEEEIPTQCFPLNI